MTNAELIAKIKAEIERRITDNTFGAKLELIDILAWLDTLESETTYDTHQYAPRPSVCIDDVARVQFASHAKVFDKKRKAVFDWEQFKEVAGIFYGFGKKDSSGTLESEKPKKFEDELKDYLRRYYNCDYPMQIEENTCSPTMPHIVECARHFAQWGAEQILREAEQWVEKNTFRYIDTQNNEEGYLTDVFLESAFVNDLEERMKEIFAKWGAEHLKK